MKTVTKLKYPRQYIETICTTCNKNLLRRKDKLKKHKPFCSELCIRKYKDPKQYKIMELKNTTNFHYLIGLICTDGHIGYPGCTKSTKTYYCNIKMRDGDLLEDIQGVFGGQLGEEGENGIQKTWRVGNPEFVQYLQKIGLTNTKTYDMDVSEYFNNLSETNKLSFMRGVIDGDGCISISSRKTNGMRCGSYICSASKPFIKMVERYFNNGILTEITKEKSNSYKYKNIKSSCSLYYYYMNGKRVIDNLNEIYNVTGNDLYLKRKYTKYKVVESYYNISQISSDRS